LVLKKIDAIDHKNLNRKNDWEHGL